MEEESKLKEAKDALNRVTAELERHVTDDASVWAFIEDLADYLYAKKGDE